MEKELRRMVGIVIEPKLNIECAGVIVPLRNMVGD
jgi:hypothetical protein